MLRLALRLLSEPLLGDLRKTSTSSQKTKSTSSQPRRRVCQRFLRLQTMTTLPVCMSFGTTRKETPLRLSLNGAKSQPVISIPLLFLITKETPSTDLTQTLRTSTLSALDAEPAIMEAESATAFPDTLELLASELFAPTTALDTVFARRSFDSLRMVSPLTSMATLRMMETSSMDASAIRTTEALIAALASALQALMF